MASSDRYEKKKTNLKTANDFLNYISTKCLRMFQLLLHVLSTCPITVSVN